MPGCNKCASCLEVIVWKTESKGPKNEKKRKKLDKAKPCSNSSSNGKKKRASEVASLHAAGHRGQVRGEFAPVPNKPAERMVRPKSNFDESLSFNSKAFDKYIQLMVQCTNTAKASKSADVQLEAKTMLPKMRKLTNLQLKMEVDYSEATRDITTVLISWSNGDAAGTRAFIPEIEYQDDCNNALKIFACAEEESKKIRKEYLGLFGRDEGVDVYSKLLYSRARQGLPSVGEPLPSCLH